MGADDATILVVDDEPNVADAYALRLRTEYGNVETAYGGEKALEVVDDSIDVVLLDRRMPNVTGDDVLEEIRSRELSCHVAMVTAVEPDFDIVEMGFDDYVVKPVDRDELFGVVEKMLAFDDLGPGAKEYYSRVSKKSALEEQKQSRTLEDNAEYSELSRDVEAYGDMIVSLAEDAIKANKRDFISGASANVKVELSKWEDRLETTDPNDPLHGVAQERVDELRAKLEGGGGDGQDRFLEAIADGFIAEGKWLNPTVRRALNLIVHNKDREKFILERRSISEWAAEGPSEKFQVSEEIRDVARRELAKR
jgi:DNA-binding response OmpR family regulator